MSRPLSIYIEGVAVSPHLRIIRSWSTTEKVDAIQANCAATELIKLLAMTENGWRVSPPTPMHGMMRWLGAVSGIISSTMDTDEFAEEVRKRLRK